MILIRNLILVLAIVSLLVVESCSDNTLGPQFEPEIINKTDSFEFQATGVTDVTQSLQYTWNNSGPIANINQASSISAGSATLTIKDAAGTVVYQKPLGENGSFITVTGSAGDWIIIVTLQDLNGTLNFTAEKRTP